MNRPSSSSEKKRINPKEIKLARHLWNVAWDNLRQAEKPSVRYIAHYRLELAAITQYLRDAAFGIEAIPIAYLAASLFRNARLSFLFRWRRRRWTRPTTYQLNHDFFVNEQGVLTKLKNVDSNQSLLIGLIGSLGDILVGLLFGIATIESLYVSIGRASPSWLFPSTLPLVEGRSFVADAICDDIVIELGKQSALLQQEVQYPELKKMVAFGENCQRRRAYEKQLRRKRGLSADSTVLVPTPGVPPDFQLSSEDDNLDALTQNSDDLQSASQEWAAPFATDREEGAPKKK